MNIICVAPDKTWLPLWVVIIVTVVFTRLWTAACDMLDRRNARDKKESGYFDKQ